MALHFRLPEGERRAVSGADGATLLEAAHASGISLNAVCGGIGICGECRVRLRPPALPPPNRLRKSTPERGRTERRGAVGLPDSPPSGRGCG
ncbi:MAG: 2Fe-2S iron-sulfur cluster binding domain-containing protein [Anaerolineae bacterium]|nr:2Fe-2S iron-sulfur cluster binding domain-containing protein [Anaerolineae bacterium]